MLWLATRAPSDATQSLTAYARVRTAMECSQQYFRENVYAGMQRVRRQALLLAQAPAPHQVQAPRQAPAPHQVQAPRQVAAPHQVLAPRQAPAPRQALAPRQVQAPHQVQAPRQVTAPRRALALRGRHRCRRVRARQQKRLQQAVVMVASQRFQKILLPHSMPLLLLVTGAWSPLQAVPQSMLV